MERTTTTGFVLKDASFDKFDENILAAVEYSKKYKNKAAVEMLEEIKQIIQANHQSLFSAIDQMYKKGLLALDFEIAMATSRCEENANHPVSEPLCVTPASVADVSRAHHQPFLSSIII